MSEIRAGYDRWSAVYDHDGNPLVALGEPVVRGTLDDVRDRAALDLGCGTGRHALWLAARGAAVTAVDFSEACSRRRGGIPGAEAIRFLVHDLIILTRNGGGTYCAAFGGAAGGTEDKDTALEGQKHRGGRMSVTVRTSSGGA
jgi:SAM-dependent methyltransferase